VGRDVEIEAFRIDRWPAKELEIPVDEKEIAREWSAKEYIRINEDGRIGRTSSQGEYLHELLCVPALYAPRIEQPFDLTPQPGLPPPPLQIPRKDICGGHYLQVRISTEMPAKMTAVLGIDQGQVGISPSGKHLY